ncbi:MAG: hypothetical protein V7750_09360 [Sneathiella sp.]
MDFSVELWASVTNAVIFLCLIAIPWTSRISRILAIAIGGGGFLCLLGFDFFVGFQKDDLGLSSDLMLLTLAKGVFFFILSYGIEKIFRTFLSGTRNEDQPVSPQETEISRRFDRNMRGLKDTRTKKGRK